MTKEDLNQMCREYQQVLSMSETEVFAMYEESKAECIASFEAEIDYWENYFGYKYLKNIRLWQQNLKTK